MSWQINVINDSLASLVPPTVWENRKVSGVDWSHNKHDATLCYVTNENGQLTDPQKWPTYPL